MAFLFVFFFWDSYNLNVGAFDIAPEVSEVVLISFNSFFFFPLWFIYFHHSIFHHTYPSSASVILLLVHSRVLLISVIALFIIDWLFFFFISSRSLLNFSCIFSTLVSRLLICNCFVYKILDHFYYHYSELFFSWTPYCFLFHLVWWAFIMSLYLLNISLPFRLVYVAVFRVAFLFDGSLWFLFIVEVPPCGWGWMSGLWRLSG